MPVQINYTSGSLNRAKRARSCKNRTKKTRRNVFGKPKPNPVLLEVLENRSANPFGPISRSARGMDEQTRQNVVWEPWWTRRGDKRNESGRSSPDRENGRRPGEGGLKSVQVTERRLYSEQANIETVVSTDAHPGTESIETAQNRSQSTLDFLLSLPDLAGLGPDSTLSTATSADTAPDQPWINKQESRRNLSYSRNDAGGRSGNSSKGSVKSGSGGRHRLESLAEPRDRTFGFSRSP